MRSNVQERPVGGVLAADPAPELPASFNGVCIQGQVSSLDIVLAFGFSLIHRLQCSYASSRSLLWENEICVLVDSSFLRIQKPVHQLV